VRTASGGRVYKVDAVVLRRLSLGETDRIVTLFTRDRGKLSAVAKGARGPRSRLGGATEPFTCFEGLLSQGQNLDVLTQAQVRNPFPSIRKDLVKVGFASHFLEIVDAGTEERQSSPELWDLLVAALGVLEHAPEPSLPARAFELQAMRLLGYEPGLFECVLDQAAVEEPGAVFHPLRGGMLCPRCARSQRGGVAVTLETLASLRRLAYRPIAESTGLVADPLVLRQLTAALAPYVRHTLEVPLRSLQFLDDVTAPMPEDPLG
jgi:DNA repair protein RecO (recombination protein O)